MTPSNTQAGMDKAWPVIVKMLADADTASGDDKLAAMFLMIDPVDVLTRVMLRNIEEVDRIGAGTPDQRWSFDATKLAMWHLRTTASLSADDLVDLAQTTPSDTIKKKVVETMTHARARSLRRIVKDLIDGAAEVPGPLSVARVRAAVCVVSSGEHAGSPCSLLVPKAHSLDDKELAKELNAGKVVSLPPDVLPHRLGGVVARFGTDGPVLHEAIATRVGYEIDGSHASLVIDHRFAVEVDAGAVAPILNT